MLRNSPPVDMFTRLVGLALRRPHRMLWAAGALVLVGLVVGGASANGLTMGLGDYDDPASATALAQHDVRRATGIDLEQGYLVLIHTGHRIDPGDAPPLMVTRVEAVLRARPETRSVLDFASAKDPRMIAANGRDTYVVARVGGFTNNAEKRAVSAVQSALQRDPLLRGRTWLGGPTAANVQVSEVSTVDLATAELIGFPILLLLLLVVFRGVVAALLPLLGAGYTIAGALLGIGTVMTVLRLSVFALNLVLALGIGLAIDFSLLVVSRFREELGRGLPVPEALRATVSVTGRTVLFSALTVSAALASLTLFPQRFLYSMGIAGIVTTLAATSFALVVLPALLALLGHRINRWAPARWRRPVGAVDGEVSASGHWYRFAQHVMRRPVLFAAAASIVLIALGLPFTGIKFTGVGAGVLPADSSGGFVYRELRGGFPAEPATPIDLIATAPDSATADLTSYAARVRAVPGVTSVSPPVRLGGGLWEIQASPAAPPLSPRARQSLREIRAVPAPYQVRAIGQTAQFQAMLDSLGAHLPLAIGLIVVTTLLILFAMTGSVILPVKALLMNALSLSAAFGALVFIFQYGHFERLLGFTGEGALESTSPIIVFALAFGLSTDYTVFLLSRIKECHDGGLSSREAVATGLERTGRIVTMAAVLLCIAVGALVLSRLTFIKELGLGTAIAVLIDATIVRAVLVPALMAIMKDANWWAPGPLRRAHRRFGLERAAQAPSRPEPQPEPQPLSL
jgi:putative drug exporter of the RND superfamily